MAVGPIREQCRASARLSERYGRLPVPPEAEVPVAPVPAPVVPVPRAAESVRVAVSPMVPVPAAPGVLMEPDAPVAAVSIGLPLAPVVPAAPVVPVAPGVPTSPALVPAVLSRLLPLPQAPTASTVASASMLLPKVTLCICLLSWLAA
jgi:hypothetical protein